MTDTDLAWAAGLFEGEGSFTTHMPNKRNRGRRRYLRVCLQNADRDVVDRFHAVIGIGNVYAIRPDPRRPNAKPLFQWTAAGETAFRHVNDVIGPHLGERRRARAAELLAEYGS